MRTMLVYQLRTFPKGQALKVLLDDDGTISFDPDTEGVRDMWDGMCGRFRTKTPPEVFNMLLGSTTGALVFVEEGNEDAVLSTKAFPTPKPLVASAAARAFLVTDVEPLVNSLLRDGGSWTAQLSDVRNSLDTAFGSQAPLTKPLTVYRAMVFDDTETRLATLANLRPGVTFKDKGYVKVSMQNDGVEGAAVFSIELPPGTRIIPVSATEALLPRGCSFAIRTVRHDSTGSAVDCLLRR
jgi:hypothetical protein